MRKVKKILLLVICAAMVVLPTQLTTAKKTKEKFTRQDTSSLDVGSLRYTKPETYQGGNPNELSALTDFEKKLENENLVIYYKESVAGIRIQNKKTGYVWGGLAQDKPKNMNKNWSAMGNSLITIDYFDGNCQSKRISMGAENVKNTWKWEKDRAVCMVDFGAVGISLSFELRLLEDGFTVEVLRDSITEKKVNKLQSVWILPFLGSVEQDAIDGYMFIPDGSGALIRYGKSSRYVSAYNERIYGKDAGVDSFAIAGDLLAKRSNDYLVDNYGITIPVYGAVHGAGENAYLGVVEKGELYASVYASPAGVVTDYNWSGIRFDYRNSYSFPVNKSGKSIITTQEKPEDFDCKMAFYLLSGEQADYSGMAVRYRELLKESGDYAVTERKKKDIPMYLHFIAADVKESLLFKTYEKLTTINNVDEIVKSLQKEDITNLTVSYEGWQKGGLNGADYGINKLDKRLGSRKDLDKLKKEIEQSGGRFYLSFDPISFNEDQSRVASSAALNISNGYANRTKGNRNLLYATKYFIHPVNVPKTVEKTAKAYDKMSLEIGSIGNMAYGDYSKRKMSTRAKTMRSFAGILETLDEKVALETPNQYMWKYAAEYTNIPLQNSQYLFETDSVPFLQIVLKGCVDYYAPYTNVGAYNQSNILRMIEYGAYPSFVLMAEENEKLMDTPLADYFSLNCEDWKEVMFQVYQEVNNALKGVEGSSMTDHKAIDKGIVETVYENGVHIYVNYTDADYTTDTGIVIPKGSYTLEK